MDERSAQKGATMSAGEPVKVSILDRDFFVACTPQERTGLIDAAHYLDTKMREMRSNVRAAAIDRVAILAALNIAHELLAERRRTTDESSRLAERLQTINAKLERAFATSLQ
ncbi:MAG: cell division protein ZapA [Rhodanobacter sp.]|jgi:cell division protein ZapA|nr:cell division protein ZapA [Rhodanobacter sp.]